ncbi:v-SNARE protein [Martiniozyma asiatica (nom. inval.)]|nr:v-SNARE protein [Martiniozyma asiatica]
MSRFEGYSQDLELVYSDINTKLSSIRGNFDGHQRVEGMKEVESLIDESRDLLDSMALEVQEIPTHQRAGYNNRLRESKEKLEVLRNELKELMDDRDRSNLFGSQGEDSDKRDSLLAANASIERSTQRLNDATRTALESETVGSSILDNLRIQRDQILSVRDTLGEADTYVDRSLRTLGSMTRRMATNKWLTYGIIALLIMLILLVLYSKFS